MRLVAENHAFLHFCCLQSPTGPHTVQEEKPTSRIYLFMIVELV